MMSLLSGELSAAWRLLAEQSWASLLLMFWLTVLAELTRYSLGLQTTAAALLLRNDRRKGIPAPLPRVSVLLVGHNEEGSIAKCVRSLRRQSFNDFEIVCVDDGSSDRTFEIMCGLRREGLVDAAIRLELRGGKAPGINLAAQVARGDLFVVVDCDCSFDDDAIEQLLQPFAFNPGLAAVSGNLLVRNAAVSVTASLQAIEYLVSIALGKAYANVIDQVCCVSGAFGAFRRDAWEQIGGMDVGGGEDLDFTMRLRMRGYRVAFARHSICYTDAPATLFALLRQRHRWDRDAYWIRLRKHWRLFLPDRRLFRWREAVHQWDFVLFNLLPTVLFPFYVTWLLAQRGRDGITILIAVAMVLFALDVMVFISAVLVTGKWSQLRLLPFLPLFSLHQSWIMRFDRCYAYATEWIFSRSRQENYVPEKAREWFVWR